MILLHPYSPGIREEDQRPTNLALEHIARIQPIPQFHYPCFGEFDYAQAISNWWAKADICIIEHDIVPSINSIYNLVTCPYDVCVYAYYLYPRSTLLTKKVIAHRIGDNWIEEGTEWCTRPALGYIRIRREVQKEAALPITSWRELDHALSASILHAGFTTHIHYPIIPHNHGREEYENIARDTRKVS